MRNFQDTFGTRKRPFISAFLIWTTVPLIIFSMNIFLYLSCSHEENMSSLYLHYNYSLYSDSFIISSSSSAINKMLYGGVIFVLYYLFPKCNDIIFSTSDRSIMVSVKTYFSFRLSSRVFFFLMQADPEWELWAMFFIYSFDDILWKWHF